MNYTYIVSIILNIIFIVAVLAVVRFAIKPKPLVDKFVKLLNIQSDEEILSTVPPHPNVTVSVFEDDGLKQKIVRYAKPDNKKDLVMIEFPGGSFVKSAMKLRAFEKMNLPYDLYILEYPSILDAKVPKIIDYLSNATKYLIDVSATTKLCLIGCSAGSYYAARVIDRFKDDYRIHSFVSICGYFGHEFTNDKLIKFLDYMYLSSSFFEIAAISESSKEKHRFAIPSRIKMMLITSTQDFLKESTEQFAKWNGLEPFIYKGNHQFFWQENEQSAQQAYKDVATFISS